MKTNDVVLDLLNKIEQAGSWQKNWLNLSAKNAVTGKPYRGINCLLLKGTNYATFKQIKSSGGTVKKGSKAEKIMFFSLFIDKEDKEKKIPMWKYYNVFNLNDCENMEKYNIDKKEEFVCDEDLSDIFNKYVKHEAITVTREGSKAFYEPSTDSITLPETFLNESGFFETAFHEACHSTGANSRLNRKTLVNVNGFKTKNYSREELVAELGALFCLKGSKIEETVSKNCYAYLKSWIKNLKDKPQELLTAISQGQKAKDFIFSI